MVYLFSETDVFSVLVGTWNVNAKKPVDDLSEFLDTKENPAIVAVGYKVFQPNLILICLRLQEMDMSAEGVLFREMESRATPWENLFHDALNKQHSDPNTYHLVSLNGRNKRILIFCPPSNFLFRSLQNNLEVFFFVLLFMSNIRPCYQKSLSDLQSLVF